MIGSARLKPATKNLSLSKAAYFFVSRQTTSNVILFKSGKTIIRIGNLSSLALSQS